MSTKNYMSARVWSRWRKRVLDAAEDDSGMVICGICKRSLPREQASVDHILPLITHPQFAKVIKNMQPAHIACNSMKSRKERRLDPKPSEKK